MKRPQRLQPLHDLAGQTERDCSIRLVETERRITEGEQRYQDLLRYRSEYEQAFQTRARSGAPMRGLREQQIFIARLSEALRAQQVLLEQLHGERSRARAHWRAAATRKQIVGKVIERARTEELMKDEQRQQRDADELSSQRQVRR